ncbi:hypothetical protein KC19_6G025900 [Ceratodon purpureus]|uniref:Uncharacterized protein n=1 Tax=Ceratodon purpureus TaxID=3225 RepID=A0A8T0HDM8_CERPU|nr:hypothetical protein KC19_6G025900 [Ceratodon purpureus]
MRCAVEGGSEICEICFCRLGVELDADQFGGLYYSCLRVGFEELRASVGSGEGSFNCNEGCPMLEWRTGSIRIQ